MATTKPTEATEQDKNKPSLKLPEDYPDIPDVKKLESDAYDFSAEKEPRRFGVGPDQVYYPDDVQRPATVGEIQTAGFPDVAAEVVSSTAETGIKAVKAALPLATEIGAPLIAGAMIAGASTPPGLIASALVLGTAGIVGNTAAQKMRIGFGDQKEFSLEEAGAATLFSLIPGFGKATSKLGTMALRGSQGAVMATGESATRQGLEMASGKRDVGDWDKMELIFSAAAGGAVGSVLGNIEYKFKVHSPKLDERENIEGGMRTMLRTLRDAERTVDADIKGLEKDLKKATKAGDTELEDEIYADIVARTDIKKQIQEQWKTFTRRGAQLQNELEIVEQAIEELEVKKQAAQDDFIKAAQDIDNDQPTATPETTAPAPEATAPNYDRVKPDPAEAGQELPVTQQRLAKVLNRWLAREEGASNDIDTPEGTSPKPEGVSGDPEVQKFVEFVNEEFPELFGPNRKKKPVTEKEFIKDATKLAEEFGVLGADDANAFDALRRAINDPKNKEYVDQLRVFEMQGVVHALRASAGLKSVLKQLDEKNWSGDSAEMNDIIVDIYNKFAGPYMDLKAANTAYGRGLKSTQFTKPLVELELQEVTNKVEEKFVADLKKASNLSPEALLKQIEGYGGMQRSKYLLQALAQSESYEEAANLLKNVQKGFQSHRSVQHNLKLGTKPASAYHRIRDMGVDLWYNSMLSSPITWMKAWLGNSIMSYYQPLQGMIGGGWNAVMATAPWYKGNVSAKQWMQTARQWGRIAKGYASHNKMAVDEAEKAFFGHGDVDIDSHWEQIGKNAFEMERTGLYGPTGSMLEEFGKWQGIPGRMMQSIDMRTRQRVLHSMWDAHLHSKFETEHGRAPTKEEFKAIRDASLHRYFSDTTVDGEGKTQATKIKTAADVLNEGILEAKSKNLPEEELIPYAKKYVQANRDKVDTDMLQYIQRNIKEISFQSNPGEFGEAVSVPTGIATGIENLIKGNTPLFSQGDLKIYNQFGPETQFLLQVPFMRTGRNIVSEGFSTTLGWTAAFKDVPGLRTFLAGTHAKLIDDLNNPDPLIAARAKGKIVASTAVLTSTLALIWEKEGKPITPVHFVGKERPLDWKQQEALEVAEGVKGNTLRFPTLWPTAPDTIGAIDTSAFEPFHTSLQLLANTKHIWFRLREQDQNEVAAFGHALILSTIKMMEDKSFYAGMAQYSKMLQAAVSDDPGDRVGRIAKQRFNPLVPSGVASLARATDEWKRDRSYKQWLGVLQTIQTRLPAITQSIPEYRDAFGSPIPQHGSSFGSRAVNQFKSPLDFSNYSETTNDIYKWTKLSKKDKGVRVLDLKNALDNEKNIKDASNALIVLLGINPRFNDGTSILSSYTDISGESISLNNIDLTELRYSGESREGGPKQGQDAFDRWQEIYETIELNYKGFKANVRKQALIKLKNAPEKLREFPKRTPRQLKEFEGGENVDPSIDPRKTDVQETMTKYRKAALRQLVNEYPELKTKIENARKFKQSYQYGKNIESMKKSTLEKLQ